MIQCSLNDLGHSIVPVHAVCMYTGNSMYMYAVGLNTLHNVTSIFVLVTCITSVLRTHEYQLAVACLLACSFLVQYEDVVHIAFTRSLDPEVAQLCQLLEMCFQILSWYCGEGVDSCTATGIG